MGKLVYRMCLVVVLVIAVAGGIYYYRTISRQEEKPEQGTFVDRRVDTIRKGVKADSEKLSAALQQGPETERV